MAVASPEHRKYSEAAIKFREPLKNSSEKIPPALAGGIYSVYFKRSTLFTFSFNAQLYIKNSYTDEVREHCNY